MNALITEEDLKGWTGFEQRGKLEAWLRSNKISYTHGKGNKLITTQEAVNKALIGATASNTQAEETFF